MRERSPLGIMDRCITHDFRKKSGSGGHCGGICRGEESSEHCLFELRKATIRLDREVSGGDRVGRIFVMLSSSVSASHCRKLTMSALLLEAHIRAERPTCVGPLPNRSGVHDPAPSVQASCWKGCVCHFSWHGRRRASYRAHGFPHLPRCQA